MATPSVAVANTSMFPNEDFISVAKQVNDPDFTGYEFYIETMGVKFYRKYREARVYIPVNAHAMVFNPAELWTIRVQGTRSDGSGPHNMRERVC